LSEVLNRSGKKQRLGYKLFKRKIYTKIVIIGVIAFAAVYIEYVVYNSTVVNSLIVLLMQKLGGVNIPYTTWNALYWGAMHPWIGIIICIVVAASIILLTRSLDKQINKSLREIGDGLDGLCEDKGREIHLSPEMEPMEQKLRSIKRTLEMRERESESAEQRKNELVMYLAHDVKTPLTSVIGYLSLLDEAPDMPLEQKAKYVNITLEKAYRLERLIDEFFEITRYNFQTGRLSKKNIDLCYMLSQMADEFYPLLAATGKRIRLQVPEDMTVYADPERLARVFNNILKNAVSYGAENSVIDIDAAASGIMVSIVFKNPGSIPKDRLETIFDKFYRLDAARSSDTGGAGLGLAIAKEIIDEHGGRIYADSDGTYVTFTVELPFATYQSLTLPQQSA